MSRHRNVRNLDLDEYYDDDYYEDGILGFIKEYTAEETIAYVKEIVGKGFSDKQIESALERNDWDADLAVNALLDSKEKPIQATKGENSISEKLVAEVRSLKPDFGYSATEFLTTGPELVAFPVRQQKQCKIASISRKPQLPVQNTLNIQLKPSIQKVQPLSIKAQPSLAALAQMSLQKLPSLPTAVELKPAVPITLKQFKKTSPSSFASLLDQPPDKTLKDRKLILEKPKQGFKFDTPSPDDQVLKARKKGEKSKQTAKKAEISKDLSSMTLGSSTEALKPIAASRTASNQSVKERKIDILQEFSKRSLGKVSLNMVVAGHVDAGKSTIMGHLLYLLGHVNERLLKKYEKEAETMKKASFAFAWVLDETEEERSRGVTIDVAMRTFETPGRKLTLLDAPGHRDFVPNMISGACQADVAMLVVDSRTGEFEAGFELGGQTREHALLLRSLGVSQVIVAVNKLETLDWSQKRFEEIKQSLLNFLTSSAGFKPDTLFFIPCSGFAGENLLKRSDPKLNWYSGPTIVEQIDKLEPPTRQIDQPFRLSVSDYFKGGLTGGSASLTVSGRIEDGSLQIGDTVLVLPINEKAQVKAIEVDGDSSKWAVAGDNVLVSVTGIDLLQMSVGSVLCDPKDPIPVTSNFSAQIVTFDIDIPLTIGVPIVFHSQSLNEPGHISKLVSTLNKATGQVLKQNPRALARNTTASVEIKLSRPVCLDSFKKSRVLGRFSLRSGPITVAAGIVTEVLAFEKITQ